MMKKFINAPENLTSELLEGLAACYSDRIKVVNGSIVVRVTPKSPDKVAIITLGGTGHEPALEGFVGEGMLDASVTGDIFAAPGGAKVFEALQMFDRPAGILLLTLNHNGDRMSANKALRMAAKANIKVQEIVIHDDIAQGINAPIEDKRGLGGEIPLIKIVGALAEQGKSLDDIVAFGNAFNAGIATLSVALKTATHPQNGTEIGSISEADMEVGMGQHGEGGGGIMPMKSADETAELMVKRVMAASGVKAGDQALLIINGSGATTAMEMLIVYRKAAAVLKEAGVTLVPGICDELLTVQEMAGFQMILCKLCPTCVELLKARCDAPYWTCVGR